MTDFDWSLCMWIGRGDTRTQVKYYAFPLAFFSIDQPYQCLDPYRRSAVLRIQLRAGEISAFKEWPRRIFPWKYSSTRFSASYTPRRHTLTFLKFDVKYAEIFEKEHGSVRDTGWCSISGVSNSDDAVSAVPETALMPNPRFRRQHRSCYR